MSDKNKIIPVFHRRSYEELVRIKKVYFCEQCHRNFDDEAGFKKHLNVCNNKAELTWMWTEGYTLSAVNERFKKIPVIPKGLEEVTKDTWLIYDKNGEVNNNVKISSLLMTGFRISMDGTEVNHNKSYSQLKYLKKVGKS